jgi:hypothetical protein
MPALLHGGISQKVSNGEDSLAPEARNNHIVIETIIRHHTLHASKTMKNGMMENWNIDDLVKSQ